MKTKELVKTKTFWAGLGAFVLGICRIFGGDYLGGAQNTIEGLGAIFIRDAIAKTK